MDGKQKSRQAGNSVVRRKSAVVPGSRCEANIPPTAISPLPIATRVITTCKSVNPPIDIPRIMKVVLVAGKEN
jgi:hypothetical protein